ncbi:MAG: DUF2934 domain-containing protein [Spirochaetota bacterium]
MEDLRKKIEIKAYENFLKRGMLHGKDVEDWLEAEKEVAGNSRTIRTIMSSKISEKIFSKNKKNRNGYNFSI